MKRETVILPFSLPGLTDKAAAQLVDLLYKLIEGVEHQYGAKIHRYNKQQENLYYDRPSRTTDPQDPPF